MFRPCFYLRVKWLATSLENSPSHTTLSSMVGQVLVPPTLPVSSRWSKPGLPMLALLPFLALPACLKVVDNHFFLNIVVQSCFSKFLPQLKYPSSFGGSTLYSHPLTTEGSGFAQNPAPPLALGILRDVCFFSEDGKWMAKWRHRSGKTEPVLITLTPTCSYTKKK